LKLIEGTFRRDRDGNTPEPPSGEKVPRPPLKLDRIAQREWKRIATPLHAMGVLKEIDTSALLAYCEAWSDFVDARNKLAESGAKVIKTKNGNIIENPYYSIKKRAMEILLRFQIEFGITPSSRMRIQVPKAPKGTLRDRLMG
jgi:P27 family predicted phage terminase small subunit